MPAKRKPQSSRTILDKICENLIVTDLLDLKWKVGQQIATGGFGAIYLAHPYQHVPKPKLEYVIKIEPFSNGPLFTEMHFYQRCCKPDMIADWVQSHKTIDSIAIPSYIASGSHCIGSTKFRFLIMEKFGPDLEKYYEKCKMSESSLRKLICQIAIRMLYALEYIHDKGYVHSDIKASNIVPGQSTKNKNQLLLLDYGLVSKYKAEKIHKPFRTDERKCHDGTIEYTSIDAHNGTEPSRRSDLEVLAYNLLKWSFGTLPWERKGKYDPEIVKKEKLKLMKNLPQSLHDCYKGASVPSEISAYFSYVSKMKYDEKPDYNKVREEMFERTLKDTFKSPYKDDFFNAPNDSQKTSMPSCSSAHYGKPDPKATHKQSRPKKKIKPSPESQGSIGPKPQNSIIEKCNGLTIGAGIGHNKTDHVEACEKKGLRPRIVVNGKNEESEGVKIPGMPTKKQKITPPHKTINFIMANKNKVSGGKINLSRRKVICKQSPHINLNAKNFDQTCYLTPPETMPGPRISMSSIFSDDAED